MDVDPDLAYHRLASFEANTETVQFSPHCCWPSLTASFLELPNNTKQFFLKMRPFFFFFWGGGGVKKNVINDGPNPYYKGKAKKL